jgi:hypothetical protein
VNFRALRRTFAFARRFCERLTPALNSVTDAYISNEPGDFLRRALAGANLYIFYAYVISRVDFFTRAEKPYYLPGPRPQRTAINMGVLMPNYMQRSQNSRQSSRL